MNEKIMTGFKAQIIMYGIVCVVCRVTRCWVGPEKLHLARKPGIIFQRLEVSKNMTNFLILMDIFTNFDKIYASKECKFRQKLGLMMQIITI